ncbi:VHS domain-containing protein [Gymnopilus junonius]|uniref:VHS domain-containing protein n=1 Tax=Gymnopilus junonius TaxID=109634 RepID=A0A9P5NVM1_GYMJU|nr:VHS domain-containing protein [Gymnopilus junonius]
MLQSPTGPASWTKVSPLEVLITRACEPSMHEPNYALHLEVAEYINQKKANNPREAAMMIARLANHRNPHIAILALALLDTLVQSCGYPFHLQISTKEFLNELVRRFPERPPPFPGPVMSRILELIHGWKEGICSESRWKEDLGNIRDMHRLLTFKGYRFREMPRTSNAAVSATANLKTAEELEEEDRAAQSAKLQELIRRGTPRDLAAAQELMKALAGANPDAKPDYRSQALTELNKLEQKVILLNEMLDNVDTQRGERFASGDAYDQVSSILIAARPKLQKWISDAENDDSESLDTFLQINDQINTVLSRYEAFKKGDYSFAANPIPQELSNAGSSSGGGTSLIDFDDSPSSTNTTSGGNPANDLADLFSSPPPIQQQPQHFGGGIQQMPLPMQAGGAGGMMGINTLGMGYQQQLPQQSQSQPALQFHAPTPMFHNGSGMIRPNTMSPGQKTSVTPPASIVLPGTPQPGPGGIRSQSQPQPQPQGQVPGYFGNGMGMGGMATSMIGGTMGGMMYGAPVQPQPPMMGGSYHHQQQGSISGFSGLGMGRQQPIKPSVMQPATTAPSTTTTSTSGQQSKDPFADLAGLF